MTSKTFRVIGVNITSINLNAIYWKTLKRPYPAVKIDQSLAEPDEPGRPETKLNDKWSRKLYHPVWNLKPKSDRCYRFETLRFDEKFNKQFKLYIYYSTSSIKYRPGSFKPLKVYYLNFIFANKKLNDCYTFLLSRTQIDYDIQLHC